MIERRHQHLVFLLILLSVAISFLGVIVLTILSRQGDLPQGTQPVIAPHGDWWQPVPGTSWQWQLSYAECDLLQPFIAAGKTVIGVEYELDPAD